MKFKEALRNMLNGSKEYIKKLKGNNKGKKWKK